jgi:hypothetical protein
MRQEGLDKFEKKKSTSSDLDPATPRLVAQCLNHYATACPLERKVIVSSILTFAFFFLFFQITREHNDRERVCNGLFL